MPLLQFDWGRLAYDSAGSGFPVLLVSGLNGLAAPWAPQVEALKQRYRIVTHDHRGVGRSDQWTGSYSVAQMTQDVVGLMDQLGITRAHVVGHSLGGAIAQTLAIEHPHRVAGLVIYASWGRRDPFFEQVMTMRRRVLDTMGTDFFIHTTPLLLYPPAWISANQDFLAKAEAAAKAAFPGVATLGGRIDSCIAFDRWNELPRITSRTLVLCARDDVSTPPNLSEELARRIPGATLELLPFGGHNAHVVAPASVTEALAGFLNSVDP